MRVLFMCGNESHRCKGLVFALLVLCALAPPVMAQTSRINGFVTDQSDGRVLEGATVALFPPDTAQAAPLYGTATNSEGLYILNRVAAGPYVLRISFIGFNPYSETITLRPDQSLTVSVALRPDPEALDEVLVETERSTGVARITAGRQRIRPEELELIPTPDVSADLASYLTTLPGIISIGDRGGQLFVRGGEPPQNLTMLDGMIVYQPFHVLGFYSAFPAEIIDRADFYAGGFGAKYAGRLSSVIDVRARPGNNRRFGGMASGSPFTGALRLEGPLLPGRASFLVSARESFIDQAGTSLYKEDLPFDFNDAFGKIHFTPGRRHRFSATGFRTSDRGRLVEGIADTEAQEIQWTNSGFSLSWLSLPRSLPIATKLTYSRSEHRMEQGLPGDTLRLSMISNSRLTLDATFSEGSFFGGRSTTIAGWDVIFGDTRNELGGLFQNVEDSSTPVPSFGFYLEPEFVFPGGWRLWPGFRLQGYNVRPLPYLEPRLRVAYERGTHHFSGAAGLYNQQVVGLNDRRDPTNVFTVWTGIPRDRDDSRGVRNELLLGRIGRAVHVLLGYRSSPKNWIEYAIEGFYKRYTNLFVAEWTAFPRLTARLQHATGRSLGFETRVEVRREPFYAYLTYGLSNTKYAADGNAVAILFGTTRLHYRPPHDRRHNVNALASVSVRGFGASLRWQFGSGLPFTRPLAFDGFALIDDIRTAFDLENSRRVVYERPFGSELPTYHRLDASIEKTWRIHHASLTLQGSAINLYDRRNIFYVDTFSLRRTNQLPFLPSIGLKVEFE